MSGRRSDFPRGLRAPEERESTPEDNTDEVAQIAPADVEDVEMESEDVNLGLGAAGQAASNVPSIQAEEPSQRNDCPTLTKMLLEYPLNDPRRFGSSSASLTDAIPLRGAVSSRQSYSSDPSRNPSEQVNPDLQISSTSNPREHDPQTASTPPKSEKSKVESPILRMYLESPSPREQVNPGALQRPSTSNPRHDSKTASTPPKSEANKHKSPILGQCLERRSPLEQERLGSSSQSLTGDVPMESDVSPRRSFISESPGPSRNPSEQVNLGSLQSSLTSNPRQHDPQTSFPIPKPEASKNNSPILKQYLLKNSPEQQISPRNLQSSSASSPRRDPKTSPLPQSEASKKKYPALSKLLFGKPQSDPSKLESSSENLTGAVPVEGDVSSRRSSISRSPQSKNKKIKVDVDLQKPSTSRQNYSQTTSTSSKSEAGERKESKTLLELADVPCIIELQEASLDQSNRDIPIQEVRDQGRTQDLSAAYQTPTTSREDFSQPSQSSQSSIPSNMRSGETTDEEQVSSTTEEEPELSGTDNSSRSGSSSQSSRSRKSSTGSGKKTANK